MEKTLVSINVPNFITVNIMAWVGLLVVVLIYQFAFKGKKNTTSNNSGGY